MYGGKSNSQQTQLPFSSISTNVNKGEIGRLDRDGAHGKLEPGPEWSLLTERSRDLELRNLYKYTLESTSFPNSPTTPSSLTKTSTLRRRIIPTTVRPVFYTSLNEDSY